jgi:hypothetical protein
LNFKNKDLLAAEHVSNINFKPLDFNNSLLGHHVESLHP